MHRKIVDLLDLSYLEDVLTRDEAEAMLRNQVSSRPRAGRHLTHEAIPDTTHPWAGSSTKTSQVKNLARQAMEKGFHAFKLKVGSRDGQRDVRRAFMLRELAGANALIMLDANQQWTLPRALEMCEKLRDDGPVFCRRTHPPRRYSSARHACRSDQANP